MGERSHESVSSDGLDDLFEPGLAELSEDELSSMAPVVSNRALLAEKRRRAEQRLEERRLRDELGYDDFELEDF
jgi:hypothetical protein